MIGGFDFLEQRDAARLELVGPGTVERPVGRDVALEFVAREGPHGEQSDIDMKPGAALVDDRSGGDELVSLAGQLEQLLDRGLLGGWLAQNLIAEGHQLIAAESDGSNASSCIIFPAIRPSITSG